MFMNAQKQAKAITMLMATLLISGCTRTPPRTPAPAAISTPIPPTPAPLAGWKQFEGRGVGLWLPENFEGGDLANDLEVIANRLKSLGPPYEQMANTIKQNPALFVLLIFDSKIGRGGGFTNVVVTKEQVLSVVTLDTFMDETARQFPATFTVADRKKVHLDAYEAGQFVINSEINNNKIKSLVYIIKNKNVFWSISYNAIMTEFEELLPTFERSANTFRIKP